MRTCSWSRSFLPFVLLALFSASVVAESPECLVSFNSAKLNVCNGQVSLVNEGLSHLADVRAYADSGIRIVKFDGPITASQRQALASLNVKILGYAPFYGYKVRMDASQDNAVRGIPGVNWTGPYLPVWKVGINLANELAGGRILEQATELDSLWVSLHPGVSRNQARSPLESIPGLEFRFGGDGPDHEFMVMRFQRAQLSSIVDQLAMNEDVNAINFHWPNELENSQGAWLHQSGENTPSELVSIFDQGIFGCGQVASALDSGLHTSHCSFEDTVFGAPVSDTCDDGAGCAPITPDFGHRKVGAHYQWRDDSSAPGDAHGHGTFVSGNMVGNNHADAVDCDTLTTPGGITDLDGMAPGAKMIIQEAGPGLEYLNDHGGTLYHAATLAHGNGAYIHNNSWGSSCRNFIGACIAGCEVEYRPHTRGGDMATWENPELLIVTSAGNSGGGDGGPGCGPGADVGAPGNAKNVFSIAANNRGAAGNDMADFSSRGPTNDRRTKPDVTAQGNALQSASVSACGTTGNSGTSFSSPTVAGLSALVREYLQRGFYPLGFEEPSNEISNPTAALIKAIMINGSVEIDGTGTSGDFPDVNQGWGRVLLDNSLYFDGDDRRLWLHDGVAGLETGDVDSHDVVALDGEPLTVTLVWHDFPAELEANPAIVNMLRLEVEDPNGDVWTQKLTPGGGLTDPNPFQDTTLTDYDDRNTVHQIRFDVPGPGRYQVRVRGIQVAMGDAQPYALAITGDLGGFSIDPPSAEVCTAEGSVDFTLTLSAQFEGTTDLSVTGEPAGTSGAFVPNPVVFPDEVSVYTLSGLAGAAGGDYTLEFTATDNGDPGNTATVGAGLALYENTAGAVNLLTPADQSTNADLRPEFTWDDMSGVAEYQIQVATDAGFSNIIIDELLDATSFIPSDDLATGTDYFWRVRGNNACGDGAWSAVFEFQTRFEPVADISPASFDFDVQTGDTASDTLFIENIGTGELAWQIGTDEITGDCTDPTPVPWLSAAPASGDTPPGPPAEPDIIVDAATLAHGQHEANLCVTTNTTSGPQLVVIPVFVNAIDPTVAFLEGNVNSLGLCGTAGEPLEGALVSVQGQNSLFEAFTDENGFYSFEISDTESPVEMTVSADLHATEVRPDVVLSGGQLNVEDFDLAGDTACVDVDPTEFAVALELGQTQDETVEISNFGTQTLNWTIPLPDAITAGRDGYVAVDSAFDEELPPFNSAEEDSQAGIERFARSGNPGTPAITGAARNQLLGDGVLLVPNTGNDRIAALDPETGDVIDADFVDISMTSGARRHALLHPDGERILLTSQTQDVVHAFDSEGVYLGVFAPIGGADSSIMDNIRGMAFHPETGNLLVTSDGGTNSESVVEFDQEGNFLGVFIAQEAGGISSPWDMIFRDSDLLLSNGIGDGTYRFDHDGNFLDIFETETDFPEQIAEAANGNILASTLSNGLWEFDSDGNVIDTYTSVTSQAGVYELPNGNLLVSGSASGNSGVHEIDRDDNLIRTILTGTSYQISFVQSVDCNVPDWVSFDVDSGSIAASGPPDTVTVTFDTDGLAPGLYEGNFCVESNDPVIPAFQVPVSLTVDLPGDFATIEGTVQTAGFCGAGELVPLEGATVDIVGAVDTYQLTTDEDGFYQIFLPDSESPIDITVTAADHLDETVTGVSFIGGDLVVNDFDLEGDSACVGVTPEEVLATVSTGDTTDETVDISNSGSQTLDWTIDTTPAPRGASEPLIGFNFISSSGSSADPQNWTRISDTDGLLENVPDDTGAATDVDIEWGGVGNDGPLFVTTSTLADDAVPQYDYDLSGMVGYGFRSSSRFFIELSGLKPNTPYEYWMVGYRGGSSIDQTVQVSDGDDINIIEFDQAIDSSNNDGSFIVNDVIADDTMQWNELSFETRSSSTGTIRIEWEGDTQSTVIGAFAVRQALACELPDWLSLDPVSGSIAAGGPPDTVTATFDAAGLPPGQYDDAFCVDSNDPVRPQVLVPVTLDVTQSPDVATIEGTVQSAGFCGAGDFTPLEGATVEVVGQTGTFTETTDENGFYQVLLDIAEDPVDITVTAPDHLDETVTDVALVGGGVVVQDFDLDGDSACIEVNPDAISDTLEIGQTADHTVDISNVGTQTLDWTIFEPAPRGVSDPLIGVNFSTGDDPDPQNWNRIDTAGAVVADLMDDTGAPTGIGIETGLVSGSGTHSVLGTGGIPASGVPLYDYDLTGMTGYWYVTGGGRLFIEVSGLTPGASYEFWMVAYRGASSVDHAVEVSDGDSPPAFVFDQVNSGQAFVVNDTVADDTMDFNDLSFATTASSSGTIRIEFQRNGTDTTPLGAFAFRQLLNCEQPDWLSVAPTAGSIDPGNPPDTITASLDATGLAPGVHEGNICVESNDPVQPLVPVPVTLDVTLPGNFATIQGTVESAGYCGADPAPLAGATVEIAGADSAMETLTTDENGFYETFLPDSESPIDITVSAAGHLGDGVTGVTFTGGDVVTEDFSLTLDAPCMTVAEESYTFDVVLGDTAGDVLTIGNVDGAADLDWTVDEAPGAEAQVDPRAHFPPEPRFVEHKNDPDVSAGVDPWQLENQPEGGSGVRGGFEVPAYSTTGWDAPGYVTIDATDPSTMSVINAAQPTHFYAATFISNDFDTHYMLASIDGDSPVNTFGTVDTATGDFTELGTMTGGTGDIWGSMKWDHTTSTLYAINDNQLFTIDTNSLEATLVGPIQGSGVNPSPTFVSIAISPEGLMYALDIADDTLIAVDKTTGDAALIGSLGPDASFAQDMDFDQSTGTLYWNGYQGSGTSQMFTIDTDTGAATLIGDVPGGTELLSFTVAIPGGGCAAPEDVSWLSVSDTAGTTLPGSSSDVDITVDSAGLTHGTFAAFLCVASNDPVNSQTSVPVTLNVTDPAAGTLEGTITSAGYCGADPHPIEGAMVSAVGQGTTFETMTDENGFYVIEGINEGESPLEVTVTAGGYLDGVETGVDIVAQQTTVVDLDLVLDAPCATADPDSIATEVGPDGVTSETLTVGNVDGGADLDWTIHTAVPAATPTPAPAPRGTSSGGSAGAEDFVSALPAGTEMPSLVVVNPVVEGAIDCDGEPGIIINDDGTLENGYSGNPAAGVTVNEFVDFYTPSAYPATYTGVCIAFITGSGPGTYDIEIVAFADDGPGGEPGTELGALPFTVTVDSISVPIPPGQQPVWNTFDISPMGLEIESGSVYIGARWEPPAGGLDNVFVAADESPPNPPNFAGGYSRFDTDNVWSTIFNADPNLGFPDYRALLVRPVEQALGGCTAPEDIPWLSVDPDAGITPAGGTSDVTVNFDAAGLASGDYEALLCVNSDDANNSLIEVPVTLTVLDQEPAVLEVDPEALDFGEVVVDTMTMLSFDVLNTAAAGAADLTLTAIDVGGDTEFDVTGGDCTVGGSIAPQDSCTVEVTIAPGAVAAYSGDVTVEGNSQAATVALSGLGVELDPGVLQLSPSSLDFGQVAVDSTATDELTVTNIGEDTAVVLVSGILFTSNPSGWFADTGNGSCEAGVTELAPGASCTIEVAFTPTAESSASGSVIVDGSDGKKATATLSGSGIVLGDIVFDDRFEEE